MQNKEKREQYLKQYRIDHAEERRKYNRKYGKDHREERTRYEKQYWKDHIEEKRRYRRQWDKEHPEETKQKNRRYWERHVQERRQYLKGRSEEFRRWKEFAGPCEKCGNGDGRVLEFHHLEPKKKMFGITRVEWYKQPITKLIEEISKCVILCRNCHTIEEFENGVYK